MLCTERAGKFSEARQTETCEGEPLHYRDREALLAPRIRGVVLGGIPRLKQESRRDKELPIP